MCRVAVLIVTHNALRLGHAADLADTLRRAVDLPGPEWVVLIGDNASDDGTPDYFTEHLPAAEVVRFADNLGFAEANNRLAETALARGIPYAYLLNQDCTAEPDFLRRALDVLDSDPGAGTAQSRIHLWQQRDTLNTIGNAIHFLGFGFSLGSHQQAEHFPRVDWDRRDIAYASGAGMLVRLDLVGRIGLFEPELFLYHEDLDFGWQVRLAGFRNVAAYDSVVYHKYAFGKNAAKFYYLERNRFLVLLENYRLATLLLILPALSVFEGGLLIFAWRQGFLREKLRAYGYFARWSNWRGLLRRRACKQRRRVVPDRRLLAVMQGTIANLEIDNWLLSNVVNPCFAVYFAVLKRVVFW